MTCDDAGLSYRDVRRKQDMFSQESYWSAPDFDATVKESFQCTAPLNFLAGVEYGRPSMLRESRPLRIFTSRWTAGCTR